MHQVAAPWVPLTFGEEAQQAPRPQLNTLTFQHVPGRGYLALWQVLPFLGAFLRKCKAHPSRDCLWLPVSRLHPPTSLEGQGGSSSTTVGCL